MMPKNFSKTSFLDTPFSDDDKNSLLDVIADGKTDDPDKELQIDSLRDEVRLH